MPADYDVIKVFNNNVVLANHLGTEKVLIKKGIGFSNKAGTRSRLILNLNAFLLLRILKSAQNSIN